MNHFECTRGWPWYSDVMGGGSSRLREMLTEEMNRVRTVERKPGESPALKLTEVLNYTAPGELDQYLEINHPAVLWVLDADKDGMFGEEDIHSFAWMMGEYTKDWEQYQVRADTRPLVRDPPNPSTNNQVVNQPASHTRAVERPDQGILLHAALRQDLK